MLNISEECPPESSGFCVCNCPASQKWNTAQNHCLCWMPYSNAVRVGLATDNTITIFLVLKVHLCSFDPSQSELCLASGSPVTNYSLLWPCLIKPRCSVPKWTAAQRHYPSCEVVVCWTEKIIQVSLWQFCCIFESAEAQSWVYLETELAAYS